MADFLMPKPDAQGLAATKDLCLRKFGKEMTDAEATYVLSKVMRYLFLINNPRCSGSDSTPENQTTTKQ